MTVRLLPVETAPYDPTSEMTPYQQQVVFLKETKLKRMPEIAKLFGITKASAERTYARAKVIMCSREDSIDGLLEAARVAAKERVTNETLLAGIEQIIAKLLVMLGTDDARLLKATPRDKTQMISTLMDRRALLLGDPTSITRIEDIRTLDHAAELLQAELARRGPMGPIIDVTSEVVK